MTLAAGSRAMSGIRFANVTKDYVLDWRRRRWRALDDVTFAVPAGTICVLVGANGSGKTTALRLAAGLIPPTAGECRTGSGGRGSHIGYGGDADLPGHFTPGELLRRLRRIGGRGPGDDQQLLDRLGLGASADRRIDQLSAGQRQLLGVAMALQDAPPIIVLDEPAAHLDPRAVLRLIEVLEGERRAGRTVLCSSHFAPALEEIADQVVLLDRGCVAFAGDRDDLRARGGASALFLEVAR